MVLTTEDRDELVGLLERRRFPFRGSRARSRIVSTLRAAKVVVPEEIDRTIVRMYTGVRLIEIDSRTCATYTVVLPIDANIALRRISVLSRLGAALIGRSVGDIVSVDGVVGRRRYYVHETLNSSGAQDNECPIAIGRARE